MKFYFSSLILEQPILLQGDSSGNVWWIPLLLKEPAKKLTNIQEPVHKIYLVKSLNSSLIDFIIIIGYIEFLFDSLNFI